MTRQPRSDPKKPRRRQAASGRSEIGHRVLLFAAIGLAFGLLLTAYATLLRVFGGRDAFDVNGTTYPGVVATYLLGPTLGGVLVALLFPLTRWRIGAVLVGFVAAVPIYTGVALVSVGKPDPAAILICALVTGGGVGYLRDDP